MLRRYTLAFFLCLSFAISAVGHEHALTFEANHGQFRDGVLYAARGPQYSVVIDRSGASLNLDSATLRLQMIGGRAGAAVTAIDELPAKSNYFIGASPDRWKRNIPNFSRVRQEGIWPGIDAIYYGNGKQLEYDLVVQPGADPSRIALRFQGAQNISLDSQGRIHLLIGGREVMQHAPVLYQEIDGARREVAGSYIVKRSRVRLNIGAYDHTRPLTIDPVLEYSTYFGSTASEHYARSAVDPSGNMFILANGGAPLVNPLQGTSGFDVFVSKFSPDGSTLLFSTYFGGSSFEYARGIATDSTGNVYITGETSSTDMPVVNPVMATNPGDTSLFVAKISADGSTLLYSTYFGSSATDYGPQFHNIAVDSLGQAVVAGFTFGSDWPLVNNFQTAPSRRVVFKLNAAGNGVIFSSYYGSPSSGVTYVAVAIDSSNNSYIAGTTAEADFPTVNALQPALSGTSGGYIVKVDPAGALLYSTYFGGSGYYDITGVGTDSAGNVYVAGSTTSTDLPTTAGAFQPALKADSDTYVAKINPSGSAIVYATYLGGSGYDVAWDLAVDSTGRAVVTGDTKSVDFPLANQVQTCRACFTGRSDMFISRLTPAGDAVDFSTYFSGSVLPAGSLSPFQTSSNVDVDAADNIYVSGLTGMSDHPTLNALYPSMIGNGDVWAAKFGEVVIVTPSPSVLAANGAANHKLVPVTLSYADGSSASVHSAATAASSGPCSVSITSNEPVNGTGDGDTSPDWIVNDSHHIQLRAERAGNGNGRIYTIKVTCPTAAGTTTVTVPKKKN